ncbi:MAG TPA: hypothetical protein VM285_07460 [Polyangia bacterium]|nr:hypothetical protein [Thermoleophilia bacterium]HUT77506.1 hypothetical protein [Polyangia bacterium]
MAFVYFGTPSYSGRIGIGFFTSMMETASALIAAGHGCAMRFRSGCGLVGQVRNELAADFMVTEQATHLMMIDDDMAWEPEGVLRLIDHGVPIVGAAGPKKNAKAGGFCFRADSPVRDNRGLVEVAGIGTGFLLISRRVIEDLRDSNPELEYRVHDAEPGRRFFDFFDHPLEHHAGYDLPIKLGEDFAFCNLVRERGHKVYLDPDIYLEHDGFQTYAGRAVDQIEAWQPAWTAEQCAKARE